jgi:dynein heavy chain
VDFEYELLTTFAKDRDFLEGPEIGNYIYGLFMEGAQWDKDQGHIVDSTPRVLFTEIPIVWIKPVLRSEKKKVFCYECPVYQTSERAGSLTTTGHSSNYVMSLEIPIPKHTSQEFWMKRGVACLCQLDD